MLLLLEISLCFDNAVVNARVLDRLTPGQQRFFLTWGLVIPVFGVRFAGPPCMSRPVTASCSTWPSRASLPSGACFC